mmetsp:Transcript_39168/g.76453  ORF Transcript_39168/g.76453 Transcript_39168/m.76453 type:complete len:636 (+) Transcript_39168:128-2035(+)|eukprot:CAMPEP_0194310284 /NCGR_PEP_ID=MMETSP0171-20130528/7218_1 /TAXON_ID=218684 /ORGANISM="Corethron pennatum, Strain L29A3" /LENGTH=635 /DNA_ID=CAMNT_0039063829 /DNA_START=29 /DNA_END=1936 /DNA_ORIENTATION=+
MSTISGKASFAGINISFADLTYSVPIRKRKTKKKESNTAAIKGSDDVTLTSDTGNLTILHGLSGCFQAGRMSALMGPSGSGKTTLLDVLSGRKTKNAGSIGGSVLLNGRQIKIARLKSYIGYVEQFDTLVSELTVEKMLKYTASLKLPASTTIEEKNRRVEEVIEMLELESCRHTVIGNRALRGISGGQAKRVNIGLALITRPRVLFLDEPTSGLDSRTADSVVVLLRRLAAEGGRTIICTIHSPTGRSFSMFDDLIMLSAGKTIYDGRVDGARAHFESLGFAKGDSSSSLPEWLVDLTSDMPAGTPDMGDIEGSSSLSGLDFSVLFDKSEAGKASVVERQSVESTQIDIAPDARPPNELSKLGTLLRFRMVAHYKDSQFLGTRFGDKIVFAFLSLSLYWKIGENSDAQSIQSVSALLFYVCAICGYGAAAFVPSLALERVLYYRELHDGCYAPATYYAAKFIEEGVLATVTSLLFCVIVHFGCALQGNFFVFAASYYLTTMLGIILAYAVAALAPTMEAANAILPTMVTIWMYFGGLFLVFDKIPLGWRWFSWTSFLRYSWASMMLNQYQENPNGKVSLFYGEDGLPMNVLEFYSLDGPIMGSISACLGLLGVLIAFFSIVGVVALTVVRHEKR